MFVLDKAILIVSVGAGYAMRNSFFSEKPMQLMELSSPVRQDRNVFLP
jgi:hypothetical protein